MGFYFILFYFILPTILVSFTVIYYDTSNERVSCEIFTFLRHRGVMCYKTETRCRTRLKREETNSKRMGNNKGWADEKKKENNEQIESFRIAVRVLRKVCG
ncbi:hypothetical protein BZA77DRAFT_5074 [Pyronema omphalodes]|nr:hypothetical protein BZA77DRAFT_5074 [Pyronema omphalodes]